MRIIAGVFPAPMDTISYYRGLGPLQAMCKGHNMMVQRIGESGVVSWANLGQMSALFMQRPYTNAHREVFVEALINKIPIWLDYDDYTFEVPKANPCWFEYQNPEVKANIIFMMKNASVVTLSTQYLAQKLIHLNPKMRVIQNAFNPEHVPWRNADCGERQKRMYWRGSMTHHKDVMTYTEAIINAGKDLPDWKINLIGDPLWFLSENLLPGQCEITEPMPIQKYFSFISRLQPSACLVPLDDCSFNRSKSNIAWLEAAMAGAVTIAPNWEEWRHGKGLLLYNNPEEFQRAMMAVASGDIDVRKSANEAWQYILNRYSLNKVNVARRQVFEELLK